MPELPEVETIRRQLEAAIKGATIKDVVVNFSGRLNLPAKKIVQILKGKKFLGVDRQAKLLIFRLSGGFSIIAHLKMSGRFVVKSGKGGLREVEEVGKHTHVVFKLSDGKELHWNDVRKFGFLKLVDEAGLKKYLDKQNYGPEPLDKSFTWNKMAMCLRSAPKKKIKPHLLDQTCIAGIGNIYASEGLWFAKINPKIPIEKISDGQMKLLHRGLVGVLKKSLAARGTSADAYVDAFGEQGEFEKQLKVYGREEQPCRRCKTILKKEKIAGRGTVFCPKCQGLKLDFF
ncbi:MAG: Formamidopyrimidine-DNA glycosylase [Candidatus Uhrbacteria bacterium GW2011_GWE2_45_35]|uniref:Formamidopyrimidine-DNA glycosylase n=2 Tax=Candidatus Uhriibacteriota TaxID=1752732 RepID=A0A0G1LP02_9BACT|nr:MAG: Formamidopyrimidine-DNA glycosylase [Candidatus Uhrbacteria bacterium GW2011_GWF2_44_350]KKU07422.1 MAG: Formamidopyrimidine-DNA glycosylase [Candidatus Uhrbacteria bacterium GW2011_GWE2_45_35]